MDHKKSVTVSLTQFIVILIVIFSMCIFLGMFILNKIKNNAEIISTNEQKSEQTEYSDFSIEDLVIDEFKDIQNPIATIEVADFGTIKVELYPKEAPNTVKNFIALANSGFYNKLTFHRIVKDFMIQGGDKSKDGIGRVYLSDLDKNISKGSEKDKEYSIKGEFKDNNVNNNISMQEGVIAMARAEYTSIYPNLKEESYNSATSQFFILTKDSTQLDGYYAGFGKVIEGMDVVKKIEKVETIENDKPKKEPVINSIEVETFDTEYTLPETIEKFSFEKWIKEQYGINY